jgi:hypothetical protein
MKNLVACLFILFTIQFPGRSPRTTVTPINYPFAANLVIVTIDGFRWQEVFTGADTNLLSDERYTPDTATMKSLYGGPDAEGRRKELLPFFWKVIGSRGQLYGNRNFNNRVNSANAYSISYPGYNEIFTGNTDITISSNNKVLNPNINVLEYLDSFDSLHGKIAAFTSWDVFPYIFNSKRSGLVVNSGYEKLDDAAGEPASQLNRVQRELATGNSHTRNDLLTFVAAKEYLRRRKPRVLFLGLGESDEAAHEGRYDIYLEKAVAADHMIAELWHFIQSTPGYRDNTTIIITTDHGRGRKHSNWSEHGMFVGGSSQTWMAIMGPGISPAGEIKEDQQIYQQQLAGTFAALLGKDFTPGNAPVAVHLR